MASTPIKSTTQLFTEIHDITGNILIMNNGSASIILGVSAMNFGLLAEEEQDGVIYGYAALLNSLNYPIQIVIKSQTKDVTNYLKLLRHQEEKTKDQYKKQLISEYRNFIAELIREKNVLDKKFFVVVPASSLELGIINPGTFIPGIKKGGEVKFELASLLEKAKTTLEPKRDHLIALFARIGLSCKQLNTQEIVRVFYNSYNQESSKGQLIADTASYTTPIVKARVYQHVAKPKQTPPQQALQNKQAPVGSSDLKKETAAIQKEQAAKVSPAVVESQAQTVSSDSAPVPAPKPITGDKASSVNQDIVVSTPSSPPPPPKLASDSMPPPTISLAQPIPLPLNESVGVKPQAQEQSPTNLVDSQPKVESVAPTPVVSNNANIATPTIQNTTGEKQTPVKQEVLPTQNSKPAPTKPNSTDQLLPLPEVFGEK